jgi:hypothetical protein
MEKHQYFVDAKKEMVRVDHLIFVSLKYSRTVDVIKSVIKRLISTYEVAMKALLETAFEGDKLKQVMHGPKTMRDAVVDTYPETQDFMDFYKFLRDLDKAKVAAKLNEFRRHVTLVTKVDGEEQYVKIETVEEYYEKTKKFIDMVDKLVHKK